MLLAALGPLCGLLTEVLPMRLLLLEPRQSTLMPAGCHLLADRSPLQADLLRLGPHLDRPVPPLRGRGIPCRVLAGHDARAGLRGKTDRCRRRRIPSPSAGCRGRRGRRRYVGRRITEDVLVGDRVVRVQAERLHFLSVLVILGSGDLPRNDYAPRADSRRRRRPGRIHRRRRGARAHAKRAGRGTPEERPTSK